MQHDPFRSGHALTRGQIFQMTLEVRISFDATRRGEHVAGKSNVVAPFSQNLLPKTFFV